MNVKYKIGRIWNKLFRKVRFVSLVNVELGKDSKFESGCNVYNVKIGRHSFVGYDSEVSNTTIGSFCSISSNVVLNPGLHPIDWVSTSPVFYKGVDSVKQKYSLKEKPVTKQLKIGNDVWIGTGVVIMGGVTIGHGAIIGANAVVTGDVKPYEIVGGVPARRIRFRFSEVEIDELLKIGWWDLPVKQLKEHSQYSDNVEKFIDSFR